MDKLRDYQEVSVEKSLEFLLNPEEKNNGLIILPTGSGKSLVIAYIALLLDAPVLIFQPTKEILEQNYQKLLNYGAFDISIFSASMNQKRISKITVATIGSVVNKPSLFKHFKYIILDECHLCSPHESMYKRFFETVKCKMLGLTATPFRMYNNSYGTELRFITRTYPSIFKKVVHFEQIKKLCDRGYWAKIIYHQIKGFDSSNLRIKSTGSGYTDESLKQYYQEIKFDSKLAKVIDRLLEIGRKNILIFTEFVEEARVFAEIYPEISAFVSGETPKVEREQILRDFKSGKIKMIANVGVLTTGFDFPELETIVIAKPTLSLGLYYQMIGRGVRPHKDKKECWVVDLCENYKRFGKVEDITIEKDFKGHWMLHNGQKQLTNVYYRSMK
jgi:DNA repair protein RadD